MNIHYTAVVAMAEDRAIGFNGTMPWRIPEDLQCFRRLTTGHPVLMGRKTYDSIGKALPKRQNIILTRDTQFQAPDCTIIHCLDEIEELELMDPEVMVIGGAQIYAALLPKISKMWVSRVAGQFEADTYFPPFEGLYPHQRLDTEYTGFRLWEYSK